jgi:hypothetical protein
VPVALFLLVVAYVTTYTAAETKAARHAAQAAGLDRYVSTAGSDSSDGSLAHPWQTIQYASDMARPGMSIHVARGTYYTSSIIDTSINGTSTARIRYMSDQKWGAKIVTSASQAWSVSGSYVDIEGFDITSSSTVTTMGIHISGGSFDRVIANRIHDFSPAGKCYGAGVVMGGEGPSPFTANHDNSAIANIIFNIGAMSSGPCNQFHGIYASTPGCIVINNLTFHNAGKGIQLWGQPTNCVVANNNSVGNQDGIIIGADPAVGGFIDKTIVSNNISYKNVRNGIYEEGAVGKQNQYLNNLVYGNTINWALLSGTTVGNVTADPQFVNYTGTISGDYHLRSTSPAIGHGTTVGCPATDIDSNPRTSSAPDIGAYGANQGASR